MFPRTPDGSALPRPLDRDVTMALVQRYVATERRRARRAILFLGGTFFFVTLLILVAFIAVGIVVLGRSDRAAALAETAKTQTDLFASETREISGKVGTLSQEQETIREEVQKDHAARQRESAMFKGDLERFGHWMTANQARDRDRLAGLVETRLKDLERMLAAKEAELAMLRESVAREPVAREPAREPVALSVATDDDPELPADPDAADAIRSDMTALVASAESLWDDAPPRQPERPPGKMSVVTFPNGDRYEGEFENGLFHGWGVYRYANGDRYEGEFEKDMKHGQGVFLFRNGDIYTGPFRHNMKHGRGRLAFANGDRYVGEFADNAIRGKGMMLYRNGNRYAGDFSNGLKHGNGTFSFANGDTYKGSFRNDLRHGRGLYIFANGSQYAGDFEDGRRHGRGRYIYPDGSEYVGAFRNGKKHGRGEAVYPDGRRIQGLWESDEFKRALDAP